MRRLVCAVVLGALAPLAATACLGESQRENDLRGTSEALVRAVEENRSEARATSNKLQQEIEALRATAVPTWDPADGEAPSGVLLEINSKGIQASSSQDSCSASGPDGVQVVGVSDPAQVANGDIRARYCWASNDGDVTGAWIDLPLDGEQVVTGIAVYRLADACERSLRQVELQFPGQSAPIIEFDEPAASGWQYRPCWEKARSVRLFVLKTYAPEDSECARDSVGLWRVRLYGR